MQRRRKSAPRKRQKTAIADDTTPVSLSPPLPWPRNYTGKRFPPTSLLHNLDDTLWNALAHVSPALFNKPKGKEEQDVALRVALRKIGMGWVATNNTYIRQVRSGFYNAAKSFYEQNGWKYPMCPLPIVTAVNVEDFDFVGNCGNRICINGRNYTNEKEEWDFTILNVDDNCSDENVCIFPLAVAKIIDDNLQEVGMDIIRRAVDQPTIEKLRGGTNTTGKGHPDAKRLEETGRPGDRKPIRHTSGNGLAGEELYNYNLTRRTGKCGSYYSDLAESKYLDQLQSIVVRSLLQFKATTNDSKEDEKESTTLSITGKRKYILLKYATGGENWAHRDGNIGEVFPYQALLMLSNSDEYDGGEFYVAKQKVNEGHEITITRRCSPNLNAGDLVIFRADKGYDHGMKTVTRGERVAVGLLQARLGRSK
eukprot:CCRYP_004547-RA/>CCRYP_004547-RA protein AED:0.23 eAED:0.23 QI:278/1/1/1/0/0/3/1590/422